MKELYSYLAGTVDADGYICIAKRAGAKPRRDGTKPVYFEVRIGLTETHATIPELLQRTFPGALRTHSPKDLRHRMWHMWRCDSLKARAPLEALLPYLRLKKEQARVALRFLTAMERQKRGRFMGAPLSAAMQAEREALYDRMTVLNAPTNRRRYLPKREQSIHVGN